MTKNALPPGYILAWTGPISRIPPDWIPCNGQLHQDIKVPDLQGRLATPYAIDYKITAFIMKT